jgi:quercetin dioxygenase-like cupin family protein
VALGVPITFFFEDAGKKVDAVVTRSADRRRFGSASVQMESLGGGLGSQTLEPFAVTLLPGAGSGRREMVHEGHELVYVIRGKLEYEVSDQIYQLAAGDSLLFEASLTHRWRNVGPDMAQFLLILESGMRSGALEQHLHP